MTRCPVRLSDELSQVLDRYGLSRNFIEFRRQLVNYITSIAYLYDNNLKFTAGSKRDALCSFFDANSDIDVLFIFPCCLVDGKDLQLAEYLITYKCAQNENFNMMVSEKGPWPGYRYVKCLFTDRKRPFSEEFSHLFELFRGNVYFKNTSIAASVDGLFNTLHGPAISSTHETSNNIMFSIDTVLALRCPSLPSVYDEWCNRKREHSWPPEWIIEYTKKNGCLLVGVGHPASDTRHIEWRLSLNKTEHFLTKSFTNIQMKCYVLLRLVLKWIVQPQLQERLSSYHVKTVMFWMSEEREKQFWRPENLVNCFMCSLTQLRTFVANKNCPNYFLKDVNLLDGKLDGNLHDKAVRVLDRIIAEGPTVVYQCVPLNVHLNGAKCSHVNMEPCSCLYKHLIEERLEEISSFQRFRTFRQFYIGRIDKTLYRKCSINEIGWQILNECKNESEIDSHIFSIITACEELGLPKQLLYSVQKEYIAKLHGDGYVARIKLATFFYYRRQLRCCIPLLSRVIKSMESCRDFEMCVEEAASASHVEEIEGVECIYLTQNNKGFLVSEIVFSPCDKLLIPHDLQDEMGRPKTVNGMYYEGWVFVDSIVYAYYLLFLACHDLRWNRGIISLFRRFHKVCAQEPGAIRIFRKDIAYRLYCRAFMLVWAFTKGFTELSWLLIACCCRKWDAGPLLTRASSETHGPQHYACIIYTSLVLWTVGFQRYDKGDLRVASICSLGDYLVNL